MRRFVKIQWCAESNEGSMDQGWVRIRDSKTEAGQGREIPLPDALWRELSARKGPKIVGTEAGGTMSRDNLTRAWKRALKRIGAEDAPMYSLRKLAISRWVGRGVAAEAVKGLAGHADFRLTMNVYARLGRDRLLFSVEDGQSVTSMSELTGPTNDLGPI